MKFAKNQFISSFFKVRNDIMQKVTIGMLYLSFFLIPLCIYLAKLKIRRIKNPEINNSYCIISLYMLKLMILTLGYSFIQNIIFAVLIIFEIQIEFLNFAWSLL